MTFKRAEKKTCFIFQIGRMISGIKNQFEDLGTTIKLQKLFCWLTVLFVSNLWKRLLFSVLEYFLNVQFYKKWKSVHCKTL